MTTRIRGQLRPPQESQMKPFVLLATLALLAACVNEGPSDVPSDAALDLACTDDPSADAPGNSVLCNE
jgi:predicted small lipoprotein YifL